MGKRLESIVHFSSGRRVLASGHLGPLRSGFRLAVGQVRQTPGISDRIALVAQDGTSLLELHEQEIAQIDLRADRQILRITLDGGSEIELAPLG